MICNQDGEVLIDVVGTGGDGFDTFNVSTCASVIVAGAGGKVCDRLHNAKQPSSLHFDAARF